MEWGKAAPTSQVGQEQQMVVLYKVHQCTLYTKNLPTQ